MERQHHAFQMVSLPLAPVLSAGPPAVPAVAGGRRRLVTGIRPEQLSRTEGDAAVTTCPDCGEALRWVYGQPSLGHRRWQRNPAPGKVGFGYAVSGQGRSRHVAEKVFDRGAGCDCGFIGRPASGSFPAQLFGGGQDSAEAVQQPLQTQDGTRDGGARTTGAAFRDVPAIHRAGAPAVRRDMAQVMSSIPLAKGTPLPSGAECREVRNRMADWDQIPARYQEAAGACYALGPLNGTFGGSSMNRARGRAVISRLLAYLRG